MDSMQTILSKIVYILSPVQGVEGLVLGGSRARGTHSSDSDIDIGIYYNSETLDLIGLQKSAQNLDDKQRDNLVFSPGEWGNWVNGGAWLTVSGYPVDFILRDIQRVDKEIQNCQEGKITAHYQTGHPHAYMNVMYRGEMAICNILWDKTGKIDILKRKAKTYPDSLQRSLIEKFFFEAGFSLSFAMKYIGKKDVYYFCAHIVRSVSALNQVWFAINKEYCLNEKNAVAMINSFSCHPVNYQKRIDNIFMLTGNGGIKTCDILQSLIDETKIMIG